MFLHSLTGSVALNQALIGLRRAWGPAQETKEKAMKQNKKKHAASKNLTTLPGARTAARRTSGTKAETSSEEKTATAPTQRDDSGEVVVFAIRLKRSERDEIHAAAGSGKASSFVRGLALAATRGDMKAIEEIVDAVHKTR